MADNPFAFMCTCGKTDWCSGNAKDCEEYNPPVSENGDSKQTPLSVLAAPLLEKFSK